MFLRNIFLKPVDCILTVYFPAYRQLENGFNSDWNFKLLERIILSSRLRVQHKGTAGTHFPLKFCLVFLTFAHVAILLVSTRKYLTIFCLFFIFGPSYSTRNSRCKCVCDRGCCQVCARVLGWPLVVRLRLGCIYNRMAVGQWKTCFFFPGLSFLFVYVGSRLRRSMERNIVTVCVCIPDDILTVAFFSWNGCPGGWGPAALVAGNRGADGLWSSLNSRGWLAARVIVCVQFL